MRKKIPWAKIVRCWEDTGNNYLVGRFDTHFEIEGRDSKSLKFSKFKALPSHRTEFLTHLSLKNLQLSPRSLLKCLRKSTRLISIRLDRVKVPYGGREADDPSTDFEVPLMLPNLKEFYFEEVTKHDPYRSVKDINTFLDELNLKPMLFFGLNSNMAWDAGIHIHVRMRGVNILKMQPNISSEEFICETNDKKAQISSVQLQPDPHYISMLRRRPVEFGGFINPTNCPKVFLYEVYVPKQAFPEELTHLVLYRCKTINFDSLISSCPNLISLSLYGEFETKHAVSQLSLSSLSKSKDSLKELSLGFIQLSTDLPDYDYECNRLSLDLLCIDSCYIACNNPSNNSEGENISNQSLNVKKFFKSVERIAVISCPNKLVTSFVNFKENTLNSHSISVYGFSWNKTDTNSEDLTELDRIVTKSLKSQESNFVLTWKEKDDNFSWKAKKCSIEQDAQAFADFHWGVFCEAGAKNGWFNLPFKTAEEAINENESEKPRNVFRQNRGF
jgi:hypothetical protein